MAQPRGRRPVHNNVQKPPPPHSEERKFRLGMDGNGTSMVDWFSIFGRPFTFQMVYYSNTALYCECIERTHMFGTFTVNLAQARFAL